MNKTAFIALSGLIALTLTANADARERKRNGIFISNTADRTASLESKTANNSSNSQTGAASNGQSNGAVTSKFEPASETYTSPAGDTRTGTVNYGNEASSSKK